MTITSKALVLAFSSLWCLISFTTASYAQDDTSNKTVIITKTIDADGKETTTKIIKEGGDMSEAEIDELIEKTLQEEGINAEVDVKIDSDAKSMKKGEKEIKIKIKTDELEETSDTEDKNAAHNKFNDNVKFIEAEDLDKLIRTEMDGKNEGDVEVIIEEEIIEKDGKIEKRIKKIKQHKSNESPKGAFLGILMEGDSEGQVKIMETVDGSAAQKAGLQSGDVIKTIDGKEVTSHAALFGALSDKKVGDKVAITYDREGTTLNTDAILGEHQGEVHIIKEIESDGGEENRWIENGTNKVIELENGQKKIFIEEGPTKTTTTKKIKKKGTTKKIIKIEVEEN